MKNKKARLKIRIKKKSKASAELNSIEKRKLEIKKERKSQRIKRKLIIFTVFAIAVCITVVIFKAPVFNIKGVVCVGQERLSEEEVLKYAKVEIGENIFITSLKDIKTRLANIPYVKESNARRIFPDKIKLWVRECEPVFVTKTDDKYMVCDVETKILEIAPENKDSLCEITFPKSIAKKPGDILISGDSTADLKLAEIIKTLGDLDLIKKTTSVDFTDISDIMILYDGRLKIKIGNTNDVTYRLKFIKEVMDKNISPHEKATIDYTGETLFVGQFDSDKPVEVVIETDENGNPVIPEIDENGETKKPEKEDGKENAEAVKKEASEG